MDHHVTLDLPPDVAQRAEEIAVRSHRRVEDVLLEWLDRAATEVPVEMLSDAQVLALSEQQMSEKQQRDLGDLLERQREGRLDQSARRQLADLMAVYRRGLIRKAQALKVAVDRGLLAPLG